jgi:uncharacterized SAM-binding protein YcdF (DUF218 family)
MFFALFKIVGFFLTPSNILVVAGLIGAILLLTRFARAGRGLMVVSLFAIAIAGLSPLGNALLLPLEQRFPPWNAAQGAPTGIVVLGGAISPEISARRGEPALNESAERMTAVAELARRYPAARIVFTGGSGSLLFPDAIEADYAMQMFVSFGIAPQRVLLEKQSRNTAENARFAKAEVQPKSGERWLLVTSAAHMPRAVGTFRKVGFEVEAYPVDWRTGGIEDLVAPFAMVSGGLGRTDTALHEWAGLLGYWLTGHTSELFPGP